jgi:hypothetical protein
VSYAAMHVATAFVIRKCSVHPSAWVTQWPLQHAMIT